MHRKYRIALVVLLVSLMLCSFMAGRQFQILANAADGRVALNQLMRVTRIASAVGVAPSDVAPDVSLQPLETFSQVLEDIAQYYVQPVKDRAKLTYGAIRGTLAALQDPYSRFMEPEEYRAFQQENQGHFEGIGATIGLTEIKPDGDAAKVTPGLRCPACGSEIHPKGFRVSVVAPLPGSPAAKAGVQAGDLILQIDGVSTEGMTLADAVKRIRGERGTTVKMLLGRQGAAEPIAKEIVRGPIEVATVETKMLDGNIGYMRVNYFYEDTSAAVQKSLDKLKAQKMRGLVLDLRNNPGGLLNRCIEVAHQFVDRDPVVFVQERGQPMHPFFGSDRGKGRKFEYPLVVLVNKGSASASEILAGAIQDAKEGKLVGTTTYGKGSVQTILPLRDGSALALTTSKWFTLSRRDIEHKGVEPDVKVESSPDAQLASADDAQYQKALELLRQQVAAKQ
jgi:carboxyl-terminal processing protease